ncbi:MAG: T9SS type A sorting domain-containing protein [Bacteroidetes bacterium]|nr:T9SS type A sorting domain-containing protein [Bacteroidota bacterium]
MKYRKTITIVVFLLLGLGGLGAQETVSATGSNATGVGGSLSYTVGQVAYTTNTGTNGSVAQGVQQPYEISTTLGINETTINLGLSIYPNPTTDYLTLKVEKTDGLNFQLFDLQGRLIESKTVNSTSTNISLESQPSATYFLKVAKGNQIVKIFKIIKNK